MTKTILITLGVLYLLITIDQAILWADGTASGHILNCVVNECQKSPFREHDEISFLINPDAVNSLNDEVPNTLKISDLKYRTNSQGFRLPYQKAKPNQKLINLYGDSFTFGLFLREDRTIDTFLNRLSDRCHFQNYGVPQFNFRQMIRISQDSNLVRQADLNVYLLNTDSFYRITRVMRENPFASKQNLWDIQEKYLSKRAVPFPRIPSFLIWNFYLFKELYQNLEKDFWTHADFQALFNNLKKETPSSSRFFHIPTINDYSEDKRELFILKPLQEISLGDKTLKDPSKITDRYHSELGQLNERGAYWVALQLREKLQEECF